MVYASAKGTLKDKLGHSHFEEELHATNQEELSYETYQATQKPVDSRSDYERTHEQVVCKKAFSFFAVGWQC